MTRRELLLGSVGFAGAVPLAAEGFRSMEQRISVVTLGVKELHTARRFYVEGLGWKPVFENAEIVFFQAGGMIFALFMREKLAEDFRADSSTFGRAAMSLAYNVRANKEVDELLNQAERAGGAILKPARATSWGGYSGYFADADGFAWEVAWNPAWQLAADGSIHFH